MFRIEKRRVVESPGDSQKLFSAAFWGWPGWRQGVGWSSRRAIQKIFFAAFWARAGAGDGSPGGAGGGTKFFPWGVPSTALLDTAVASQNTKRGHTPISF